jgi:hypothetical protein
LRISILNDSKLGRVLFWLYQNNYQTIENSLFFSSLPRESTKNSEIISIIAFSAENFGILSKLELIQFLVVSQISGVS